jgi:hypothetical protein
LLSPAPRVADRELRRSVAILFVLLVGVDRERRAFARFPVAGVAGAVGGPDPELIGAAVGEPLRVVRDAMLRYSRSCSPRAYPHPASLRRTPRRSSKLLPPSPAVPVFRTAGCLGDTR